MVVLRPGVACGTVTRGEILRMSGTVPLGAISKAMLPVTVVFWSPVARRVVVAGDV